MVVLVTGADGLLGNNLVRELIDQGYEVRVLLLPGNQAKGLDDLNVIKFFADISQESGQIDEAIRDCEAVFHCAAITDLQANFDLFQKVNVAGTENIIKSCLKNKTKRLVYVGSASSFDFGNEKDPGNEEGGFAQEYRGNLYMESKHQAMHLIQTYVEKVGLDAVIVAPTFMLGDYDTRPSSGELLQRYMKNKLSLTSPGGRNFVHVKDVAKGMILAFKKGKAGEKYILGGQNLTYVDFFSKLNAVTGCRKKMKPIPKYIVILAGYFFGLGEKVFQRKFMLNPQLAKIITLNAYYTPKKAVIELGMPQTPIEEAIKDSIQSLKKYGYL
jgi:dihydroflavonol-4-reductase